MMAEPFYARVFGEDCPTIMDPSDELDWAIDFRGGDRPVLQEGEFLAEIVSCRPTDHAAGLGVEVLTGAQAAAIVKDCVRFWVRITQQDDPAWEGSGTRVGIEVTIRTTADRVYQLTGLIQVAHK